MSVTCPANDSLGICGTMESAGAGLGVFIQYLGQSLPFLLIVLAIVGIFVAIGLGIANVLKKSIVNVQTK